MTKKRSIFVNLDESIKPQVKMGNGDTVQAQEKRITSMQTKKDTKLIQYLLFVLVLDQNLQSFRQHLMHRYAMNFDDNQYFICDREKVES